jgi:pyridoxal 5'-phosphate synthase pdxS subunit
MSFKLDLKKFRYGTELLKRGFAKMQKGGVIMDVTNADDAVIAEEAGAVAVMALERVPADIRADGGVARMADPLKIQEILDTVTIPVMAKARIGHFVEAQVLESLGVDMVDESGNLGEGLRRIWEGAAMIRTKGEAGTGNVIEAVRHQREITKVIHELKNKNTEELQTVAREIEAPFELVTEVSKLQRLPVVNFAAGGIATPSDAAMMIQLGSDGVFVGSGIFKSENPTVRAKAIVEAVTHYDDPKVIAEVSKGLGQAMPGIEIETIPEEQRLQERGW